MPYINSNLTMKLTEEKKNIIKEKLGELISILPGKSEEWLFVGFSDNKTLYFRGEKKEKAAVVEVQICGSVSRDSKEELTSAICKLLKEELSIDGESIYVIFHEIDDWGYNGTLF